MGPISILLAIGVANGALLAALVAGQRQNRAASLFLAGLIALVSLRLVTYVLGFAGAYDAHRWLTFAPLDLSFAYGPLLWLYVESLTRGTPPPGWRRHLIPALLQLAYQLAAFALPLRLKWRFYTNMHLKIVEPIALLLVLLSCGFYFARAWRRHAAYQAWLDEWFGNREQWRLTWLRALLIAFAAALMITAAFALWSTLVAPLDYFGRTPVMLAFCALTYALGLLGWRHGAVAYPPERDLPPPEPSRDTRVDYAVLAEQWRARTDDARWWAEEQITLGLLARRLAVSERTLSRGLREGAGCNFNAFINGLRVAAVQRALAGGEAGDLLTLALACGFNSKASFNRAFKAATGQTPSAWRADQIPPK